METRNLKSADLASLITTIEHTRTEVANQVQDLKTQADAAQRRLEEAQNRHRRLAEAQAWLKFIAVIKTGWPAEIEIFRQELAEERCRLEAAHRAEPPQPQGQKLVTAGEDSWLSQRAREFSTRVCPHPIAFVTDGYTNTYTMGDGLYSEDVDSIIDCVVCGQRIKRGRFDPHSAFTAMERNAACLYFNGKWPDRPWLAVLHALERAADREEMLTLILPLMPARLQTSEAIFQT